MIEVNYRSEPSNTHHHIEWLELYGDGTLHECAIMRRDPAGNVFFFPINNLDEIDKTRLGRILSDRNAATLPLWDLMANKTLGNGVNALEYFHQLVKVITPQGKITDPRLGQMGVAGGERTGQKKIDDGQQPQV